MTAPDGSTAGQPDCLDVELAQDRRAPGQARRAVREALAGWRLPQLADSVVLAASELVTNAVRHGRPPVSLRLRRRPEQVRLEVHDADPAEPPGAHGEAVPDAESGRGLGIVRALADEVGVDQVADDGKIVRAAFTVRQPDERAQDEPPE